MAGSLEGRSVAFFVLFLFVFAPFTSLAPSASFEVLEEATAPNFVGENTPVTVDIRPGQPSQNPFELTLPSSTGSITNLEMTMQSVPLQNSQTLLWQGASAWNHPDANHSNTYSQSGSLTGSGSSPGYDFNNGAQGWTFSNSFSGRVTTPACGYNGSSGGSLRTYAGSTYATSPVIDLSNRVSIPFHAWVHEGQSGCGETPDTNENLQFQYKDAAGTWTAFRTFSGGGAVTSNSQFMTTLPAGAYHSNFQVRIHQNSGSGTCCDYWFVDDVKIVLPPVTEWTSPSFGYNTSNSFSLAEGPYAPMYLNADFPENSFISWTLIDDVTGENLSGFEAINGTRVHLDAVDWSEYGSLRLRLELLGSSTNAMPLIESISAGGLMTEEFTTDPSSRGWDVTNATVLAGSLTSLNNSTVTSPWFANNAPIAGYLVSSVMSEYDAYVRHHTTDNWTAISLPYSGSLEANEHSFQLQFIHNSTTPSLLDKVQVTLQTGAKTIAPSLDLNNDGINEWGGEDVRIGSWGFQDKFGSGEFSTRSGFGFSGIASTSTWIPTSELGGFGLGISSENGNMTGISLRVGGSTIISKTIDGTTVTHLQLNASELDLLEATLSSQSAVLYHMGEGFAMVDIEVYGNGFATFSNLAVPYNTSISITADEQSPLVMAANSATRTVSSTPSITLPFTGLSNGKMVVEVTDLGFSEDVETGTASIDNATWPMTPSQRWMSFTTRFNIDADRSATLVRLDVQGDLNHATWLLPVGGGTPLGQGDSHLVELHPTEPITVSSISATMSEMMVQFRIEQGWDDEQQLSVSMRVVLDNDVVSRPSQSFWGGTGLQALENDLVIKSVLITDDNGPVLSSKEYLAAGTGLNFSIDIGYEGVDGIDSFADGDAEVQLWQGSTMVANTTSLDGDIWNVSDAAPFSFGDLDWTVRVIPLEGGGITNDSEQIRSFKIDPTSPSVIFSSVDWYDHRVASTSQTVQFQILDPVLLPSNVQLMLWREWADDTDLNGLPSANEYNSRSLIIPTDLTVSTGLYTLLFDDSMGSLGQKVAGYLVGTDASGQSLQDGGTSVDGEHLFMYQLGPDGPPTLPTNAMSWNDGVQSWLHPGQPYTLRVDMNEPNGASDLTTVEIQLASNILTSPLSFTWDFVTDSCTSDSIHLIIHSCDMLALSGAQAGPYEKETRLIADLELAWTTPDLGDTFREPSVRIVDRAGQEVLQTFPALRWRFSPALMIPQETVSLVLTQGSSLEDGARIPPNSPFELTGGLVFEKTTTLPAFNCSVDVMFAGQTYSVQTYDGIWNVPLVSPSTSGTIPLTWSVGCLPPQGIDSTAKESSVKWMIVDGLGPEPKEVQTPRPGAILSADEHEVTIVLSEEGGIDYESLRLVWWVEDTVTGDYLRGGDAPFLLQGTEISGLNLVGTGTMDLSVITDEMLIDLLTVNVLVEGRDLAGNQVLGANGESSGNAVTSWLMEWRRPTFDLDSPAVQYSRLNVKEGETTAVQIFVKNTGTLDGSTSATISVIRADGTTSVLRNANVEVAEGSVGTILLDWGPEKEGLQWIEVVLENGKKANGPSIDVRPEREPSFTESVFGEVNPVLGSVGLFLAVGIIGALLLMARNATVRRGSKSEIEWDEYSDYLEDEEEEFEDPDADLLVPEAAVATTVAQTTAASTDGWTQGADGVWWWQDPNDSSWWYKDANGEILQYK
jgi:hypothetical protein